MGGRPLPGPVALRCFHQVIFSKLFRGDHPLPAAGRKAAGTSCLVLAVKSSKMLLGAPEVLFPCVSS